MNIDTLRKKYPGYSDDEILTGLQATAYPDYSVEEIKQAIGYKPRTRNVAAVANDLVIEAANAAAGWVSSAASFVSPGNRVSQFIDENIVRAGEEKQSDFAKDAKGRMRAGIDKAQGVGDELAAVGGYVVDAPALAVAQAVGSFVGPGAAIKGSSLLAQAAGAGTRGAARAGMAGGSAAGGAMAGGDAAQTAYELVKKAGGTEEQAQAAAREASVIPAAVGAAGGVVGAERLFAGAGGPAGGVLRRAAVTGGTEALQEGVEEGVTQFEGQRAAAKVDPTIDPTKGVAAAAGLGAVLGGVTGAGVSLITRDAQRADATQRLAEAKTLDDAIAAANDLAMPPAGLLDQARGFSAAREAQAMAGLEAQNADDQDRYGNGKRTPWRLPDQDAEFEAGKSRVAADGSIAGATRLSDPPLADRILTVREQLADPQVRDQIRALQPELLREAAYYVNQADNATGIPEATRERMLAVAEAVIQRATLRQMQDPQALGSREFGAPGQLGANAAPAQIGLDTSFTGNIRVDSAGNAAPETRADSISTAQRVNEMRERRRTQGMEGQTPRDQMRGAGPGVMVGDGTLTTPQRPARPARPVPQLTSEGNDRVPVGTGLGPRGSGDARAADDGRGMDADGRPADAPAGQVPAGDVAAAAPAADAGVGAVRDDATLSELQAAWRDAAQRGDSMAAKAINERIVEMKARTLKRESIDAAAGEAATSPTNDRAEPTDAQKEAGNYKKGHVRVSGLDVTIENPKGSVRRSKADEPTKWQVTMPAHYGYIKGTKGSDGDHVDLFIGDRGDNGRFWIINQNHAGTKRHDEHKVITGVDSAEEAVALYKQSFADNFGDKVFDSISAEMGADALKARLPSLERAAPVPADKPPLRERVERTRKAKADPEMQALRKKWKGMADKPDALVRATEEWDMAKQALTQAMQPGGYERGNQIGDELAAEWGQSRIAADQLAYLAELTKRLRAEVDRVRAEQDTPGTFSNKLREKRDREASEQSAAAMQKAIAQDIDGNLARIREMQRQGRLSADDARTLLRLAEDAADSLDAAMKLEDFIASKSIPASEFTVGRGQAAANDQPTAEAPAPQPAADAETAVAPVAERNAMGLPIGYRPGAAEKATAGDLKDGDWITEGGNFLRVESATTNDDGTVTLVLDGVLSKQSHTVPAGQSVTRRKIVRANAAAPAASPAPLAERVERTRKKAAEPVAAPAPDVSTHKDPGEPAEPATPAVVKEAIQTAARNDGRPIKDVKAEALRLIDEAMAGAKDENDPDVLMYAERSRVKVDKKALDRRGLIGKQRELAEADIQRKIDTERQKAADNIGYVTISVPGDGTFKVLNTKERLAEFRKKVEASPGFKAQRPGPIESARVNGYGMKKEAGSRFGVESGSGSTKTAIEAMIDDGDPQAAVDYAAARGLSIADVLKGDKDRLKKAEGLEPTPEPEQNASRSAEVPALTGIRGVAEQGAAAERMRQAQEAGTTWAVGIPGKIPEYEAPTQSAAEEFITPSMRKQGFVAYKMSAAPATAPAAEKPKAESAPQPQPEKAEKQAPEKIDDFGEKLAGARKDYAATLKEAESVDIAAEPLSKSWPEPDYQKMLDGGADPFMVAFIHAARDEVPTKPQKGWKLKGWVAQTTMLRDMARKLLDGTVSKSRLMELLGAEQFRLVRNHVGGRAELYEAIGHGYSLKGITFAENHYAWYRGQDNVTKWAIEQKAKATAFGNWPRELAIADTKAEALRIFKEKIGGMDLGRQAKGQPQFVIYRKRGQEGAWIGKKIGREYIDLKKTADVAAARAYMAENLAELEAALEKYKTTPLERNTENRPRVGDDHRNGAPVTPQVFAETFGFRGVQFGNYVEQGRRQSDLNEAYDGLMDLAAVLGVPPRALSLNGRLGLAFGARGKGGKNAPAAHFEPGNIVINLTKGGGPGSLAHEWWHSLDNYFARQSAEGSAGFVTENASDAKLREEMRKAFAAVRSATGLASMQQRFTELDKRRSKPYWNTPAERSARSFESYVIAKLADQGAANDYLANVVSQEAWEVDEKMRADFFGEKGNPSYPYPLADEMPAVRTAFDEFFRAVETRETDSGTEMFSIADDVDAQPRPADTASDGQASPRHQQLAAEYQQRLQGRFPGTVFDAVPAGPAAGSGPAGDGVQGSRSRERAAVATVAKRLFGQEVVFVRFPPGSKPLFNGAMSDAMPGVVFINADATKPMMAILGHELVHRMSADQKTLYQVLARRLNTVLKNEDKYVAWLDSKYTPEQRKGLKYGEELHADVVGDFFTDPQFWQDMAAEQPSLFQRVAQAILRFLDTAIQKITDIRPFGTEQYITDLNAARAAVVDAMRQFSGAQVGAMTSQSDGINLSPGQRDVTNSPEFKRWFGDSKVVDEQGKPLVVYHGTGEDFAVFKPSDGGAFGPGIYLADTPAEAQRWARRGDRSVMPVFASIQNPYRWTDDDAYRAPALVSRDARAAGHDGIIREWSDGTKEIVAFRPEQIKSAIGNRGTFDPASSDINLSIADTFDSVRNLDRQKIRDNLADLLGKAGAKVSWWDKTLGTQYAKAQKFPEFKTVFDKVQQYLEDTSTLANQAADLAPDILPKLETWKDLARSGISEADASAIAGPIYRGTLEDQKAYTNDELRTRFKLNEQQIGMYRQFREAVENSLDQAVAADVLRLLGDVPLPLRNLAINDRALLRDAVDEFLTDQVENGPEEKRLRMSQLREDIRQKYERVDQLKEEGYAPLMRFGRYFVHVNDGKGETLYFGMYESRADANAAAREMASAYPNERVDQGVLSQEQHKLFAGVPLESMEMFAEAIGAENSEVFQQYIRLAKNNRSALKRLLHRKGTAGFSRDVSRSLAAFITSNARLASGGMNLGSASDAAVQIRDGDVKDEAIKLIDVVKNPSETAAWARSLLFMNFIGGSAASALVNLTQPITMTAPYLSQWGGVRKAALRLLGAGKAAASGNITDPELRAALKRAEDDGIVSPQEIHHLQAEAMGTWGTNEYAKKAAFVWGSMFSLAEQFNRRVTFIAAYQTAKAERLDDPFAFAEKAVVETQGLYNRANAPNWARNPVGATALTFKQFSIHYLEWMQRMAQSGPGGKRAVLVALAIMALTAGLQGLPFAEDLDDLIDTLAQALGYSTSARNWKREFIADTLGFGDIGADVAMRGLSAVPGVPMDVSMRMSMGNLLPATGILLRSNTDRSRDVLEVGGAAGGLAKQYIDAGQKALRGDFGGAAIGALPMAMQNIAKSIDIWTSGEYRDTRDRKIMEADEVDGLMKFVGFQPAEIARESRVVNDQTRRVQLVRNVESEIANKWAQGIRDKDQEKVSQARAELAAWNRNNPTDPINITTAQIVRRVRELGRSREDRMVRSAPRELRASVQEALQ